MYKMKNIFKRLRDYQQRKFKEYQKFSFKVVNLTYKRIDKIDNLDYYMTLCEYIKPNKQFDKKRSLKPFDLLKWETIIKLKRIDLKKIDIPEIIELYSEGSLEEKELYNTKIFKLFSLLNFIRDELDRFKKIEEANFEDNTTGEERQAGIESLSKFSELILAESISKDWGLKLHDVYLLEYREVLMKRLKTQTVNTYEKRLNEIMLKRNK